MGVSYRVCGRHLYSPKGETMSRFFAINRKSSTLLSPCSERVLSSNPHVRGFEIPEEGILVRWWNKDYTLFPNEVMVAIEKAAEVRRVTLEKVSLPILFGIDPLGGAQDYQVGSTQVHVTCVGKLGTAEGNLPPVTVENLPYWLGLLRMIRHPGYQPLHWHPYGALRQESPLLLRGQISKEEWGYWEIGNLVYFFNEEKLCRIHPDVKIRLSQYELSTVELGKDVEVFLHDPYSDDYVEGSFPFHLSGIRTDGVD